jgi:hypothetical protein
VHKEPTSYNHEQKKYMPRSYKVIYKGTYDIEHDMVKSFTKEPN